MSMTITKTLTHTLLPQSIHSLPVQVGLAIAGSLLLTLSAKLSIPFIPVPFTMQTFAVLVIGMAFGWRLGASTVLFYLAQGALGLPVFATGAGIPYMVGPTGGYLIGFVFAAALCGLLAEKGWDRTVKHTAFAMTLGTAVIYLFGGAWLSLLIGVEKALAAGIIPFIPGEIVKIVLACAVMPLVWKWVSKSRAANSANN
ncbi:biotin transporter BioY [Ostreibacterium oceani]|uniref:Biotin transporter n=1 Tax=Ostreibacterium oceani TaxID=2654998 RepID=A0A6N7EYT8_9GAMM|nr:biotin transporter BioY [Ostreibacterium oceani]MPV86715.1 biotin transporter BioY [Ostreibacterium oceani]